jgi:hypothetical protein
VKRWVWVVALLLGAALVVVTLRDRMAPRAPAEEEIDDASKQALGEILRQEEE